MAPASGRSPHRNNTLKRDRKPSRFMPWVENFLVVITLPWTVPNEFRFPLGFSYLDHLCCHNVGALSPVKSAQDELKQTNKQTLLFSSYLPGPLLIASSSRFSTSLTPRPATLSQLYTKPFFWTLNLYIQWSIPLKSSPAQHLKLIFLPAPTPSLLLHFLLQVCTAIIYSLILEP